MIDTARRAAYEALSAVMRDGAYTGLALKKHIKDTLSDADKRFASTLVRTTLENLLYIDYSLNKFITAKRVHGSVRNVLRLGACQILFMNVSDYAAVSESVKLVKKIKPQMSGFVNAVLRKLSDNKSDIDYPAGDSAYALSIRHSYPEWICQKFIDEYDVAFTKDLLSYQGDKGTSVRDNTIIDGSLTDELDRLSLSYEPGEIEDSYVIQGLSGIENLELFTSGKIAVQSKSAMKAVLAARISEGDKLLDCCAAPGGKSAYAAALCDNSINIVAWDIHEHRVDMTNANFKRLGVKNAKAVLHDACSPEPCLYDKFDVVMVDAPCSAMGLMTRNPDIRYTRKQSDIDSLAKKQLEILGTCAAYVKKGGTLAYYTCSINKQENEQVTEEFLESNKHFEYIETPQTLYPHIEDSDGFYIAVMRRLS
ncbi:MAG: 16S rRNA (cytosine(967)-C(5))-methyltransferase RsmB [Clostridia bacterium]|nr:16S rRNA (cytosine(967)-C(5))-methyltransferase RsmB [Clostridia bacterium]MBT7121804.1 16S rRNA (cytosine(967)-C(5))-methyltransferase RsmB [Clostridia bacterium]